MIIISESEMLSETKKLISDFNEAKLQIIRLNYLWQSCNNYSINGNFKMWNWQLDRVFVELTVDMDDEDKEKDSKKEGAYYKDVIDFNLEINNKDFNKNGDGLELYNLLIKKERTLRRLQNAAGKGGRKRKEGEDLMD